MTRRDARRSATTGLAVLVSAVPALASDARAQGSCEGSHWVGAWATSPTDRRPAGYRDQTLRMIVTPHQGGSLARVRLTNRFGDRPVRFGHVRLALRRSGPRLVRGSGRRLSFRGRQKVTVQPGGSAVSDPVDLRFAAFQDLAVSMYSPRATGPATRHAGARQTSFLSPRGGGDHAADEGPGAFEATTTSSYFVEAVEVQAPERVGTVVALGDSITDGFQHRAMPRTKRSGGIDQNARYPDFLARRLLRERGVDAPAVLNAGISGNRVLRGGLGSRGQSALARIGTDVLAAPGVTDVIVLEGINDLGLKPRATPGVVIAGLERLAGRLRGAGLNVLLGTLTPAGGFGAPSYGSPRADADRRRVNRWIRASGISVVDFDAAVRDPAKPSRLRRAYDSGDHLHPSSAGYRAMADAVDLSALRRTVCAASEGRRRPAFFSALSGALSGPSR